MLRRVDVRSVIERVRVERGLHSKVPVRPAARADRTAAQHRKRLVELVALSIVDEVAALDHEIRTERPDRSERSGEHMQRERLLWPEGGLERRAQPTQKGDTSRGGRVEHMRVGYVRDRGEHLPGGRSRSQLEPVDQRLPGADP